MSDSTEVIRGRIVEIRKQFNQLAKDAKDAATMVNSSLRSNEREELRGALESVRGNAVLVIKGEVKADIDLMTWIVERIDGVLR